VEPLNRTPLHERHLAAGAKLVPFAGYAMPVQYTGVLAEHRAVRSDAGVFDVSHMGEFEVEGPNAERYLQRLLSNDVTRLEEGEAQYTLLTNERGGIIDDLIVYRTGRCRYLLIVNAANRATDFAWLEAQTERGSDLRDLSDEFALLAVQGPRALARLELPAAPAFTFTLGALDGVEVMINRTGYTGEEGVELACAPEDAPQLWDAILARGVVPCGLGARDTLRLEVCYPLHGNDIDPDHDAISSGLRFACALESDFTGVEALRAVAEAGPAQRLVAFTTDAQSIPRQGMAIAQGGTVTSGSLSPMLGVGIGLGYVPAAFAAPGTALELDLRGRTRSATVTSKPIYKRTDDRKE
jgi:aminomethyltransferase